MEQILPYSLQKEQFCKWKSKNKKKWGRRKTRVIQKGVPHWDTGILGHTVVPQPTKGRVKL